ncbi:MAG: thioredoxin domain-containing protein [Lachnospiraceae bacterium]|nr:thioredoxin domain-containing protein [Lachnospiraceae bacterium]
MSNHLKEQSSPYLLQHSDNPVDWYPWCEEAFRRAAAENKPVFLSVGYSTCHWCHVMAHESFENPEIAGILNEHFISIKVDREERPDIDSVYMAFCQAFTGSGGWPMTIFMTPEQEPFFAGTYFPPTAQYGRIGFRELLLKVVEKWQSNHLGLLQTAEIMLARIKETDKERSGGIHSGLPEYAARLLSRSFDAQYGGFGQAPKFPTPHNLIFLTLYSKLFQDRPAIEQVNLTLDKMRRGGIFDQIGYGFSRYSTDEHFLIPHFEKMLYDNALLIMAYCAAYKSSGNKSFLDTARKTAEYIFREMTGKAGEFYSAQDADSEGEEGRFYAWEYDEICAVLGEEKGREFCDYFGMSEQGNFDGKNIPNLLNGNEISEQFQREIEMLYARRKSRGTLHLDDKVLTAWNALMICAMSMLYRVTGNRPYLEAAKDAHCFIEKNLVADGVLYVSWRSGLRSVKGFLYDYAYYAAALLCLYDATSEEDYLKSAVKICETAKQQFADEKNGGYYMYGTQNDSLVTKPKETYDGALPSGNSVMAYCFVRLSQLLENGQMQEEAERQLAFLSDAAKDYPAGYCMFLISLLFYLYPPQKITVVLGEKDSVEQIMPRLPLYADIRILRAETEEYKLLNNQTTYYVCKNQTCLPPSNQMPF